MIPVPSRTPAEFVDWRALTRYPCATRGGMGLPESSSPDVSARIEEVSKMSAAIPAAQAAPIDYATEPQGHPVVQVVPLRG